MIHPTPHTVLVLLAPQPDARPVYDTPPVVAPSSRRRPSSTLGRVAGRLRAGAPARQAEARHVSGCAGAPRPSRANPEVDAARTGTGPGRDNGAL